MSRTISPVSLKGKKILLTGATGYIGGRLLPLLLEAGAAVRCLARKPQNLDCRDRGNTEVVQGDLLQPETLRGAFEGISDAYYLVHALGAKQDFEAAERQSAENFLRAAEAAGVRRIVYLGGLAQDSGTLSPHMRSRHAVGAVLRGGKIPVVELRASIIIGSGSLSFEMIRALVERLPLMVTPRWVSVRAQPIAVEDVLAYLQRALTMPLPASRIFEIGGKDVVTYGALMRLYAASRGLKRWMVPVPLLTPYLSSLWLGLITPLYARVGRKLIDSITNESTVGDDAALTAFDIEPMGVAAAIERAIALEDAVFARTRWSDALSAAGPLPHWAGVRFGNRIVDSRVIDVDVPPEKAFAPIQRIGGEQGWYFADWLWRLRATLDLFAGGVGMRRGRTHAEQLRVGDAVDFWRVESIEPGRRLRLQAEMRLPGRAWLEFEVTPSAGGSRIRQTASYDPVGLWGLLYWYLLFPLHEIVFRGMLRAIAAKSRG